MIEINQSFNSWKIEDENDWPSQIPIMPTKGSLSFCGTCTLFPKSVKIAIEKAGPKTHGKGKSNKLKVMPPKIPIKIVVKIIWILLIKHPSKKIYL